MQAELLRTTHVSFGTGGTAGFAFYGVMRALQNVVGCDVYQKWKCGIEGAAGTSAGAVCALWFVLHIDDTMTSTMLSRVDLSRVVSLVHIDQCSRRLGFSDMNGMRNIIHMILECGGLSANATMTDLYRFTRMNTIFVASNLETNRCEYISHASHGNMRIDDAVCASCAIPLLYHPVRWRDTILLDGCMTNRIPDCFPRNATLYIALEIPKAPLSDIDVIGYISRVLSVCSDQTCIGLRESGKKIYKVRLRNCTTFDPTASVYDIERDGYVSGVECFTGVNITELMGKCCHCYVCSMLDPVTLVDEECPP